MALADVIDKCGGSLCGKIVYEPYGNKVDSVTRFVVSYGNPYVEFYFAGKDSLGNIEEIDVSTLQGISRRLAVSSYTETPAMSASSSEARITS